MTQKYKMLKYIVLKNAKRYEILSTRVGWGLESRGWNDNAWAHMPYQSTFYLPSGAGCRTFVSSIATQESAFLGSWLA